MNRGACAGDDAQGAPPSGCHAFSVVQGRVSGGVPFALVNGSRGSAEQEQQPSFVVAFDLDPALLTVLPAQGEAPCPPEGPFASAAEAQALCALEEAGAILVLFTAWPEDRAVCLCEEMGLHPLVLSDELAVAGDSLEPLSLGERRAEALARKCVSIKANYRSCCVVATQPADARAMFEASCALALRDAGADACAGADAVFAPRAEGGLVAALERALSWVHGRPQQGENR